jgi:hypothetical protein
MRVNIYAEEMTGNVELVTKTVEGQEFAAVRFWLYLPATMRTQLRTESGVTLPRDKHGNTQVRGPFLHRPGDDDSSAVTFWGKRELRSVLARALGLLDAYYGVTDTELVTPEDEAEAARYVEAFAPTENNLRVIAAESMSYKRQLAQSTVKLEGIIDQFVNVYGEVAVPSILMKEAAQLWREYYEWSGNHMILTEEGWEPGDAKESYTALALEEDRDISNYITDEVNAPA